MCDELKIANSKRKLNKPKSSIDQTTVLSQEVNDEDILNQETADEGEEQSL